MIESFRSLFAPPRDLILLGAALWIGLALAEKRSERHSVSKEALNNIPFYSILGFIIGGRSLFALANVSSFVESPLSLFSINIDLFDSMGGMLTAILVGFAYARKLSHGRKITFRIRSMLAKQVGHDQVYRRTVSHENNQEEAHTSMPMSCL